MILVMCYVDLFHILTLFSFSFGSENISFSVPFSALTQNSCESLGVRFLIYKEKKLIRKYLVDNMYFALPSTSHYVTRTQR